MKSSTKKGHGGARKGSGRPRVGKFTRSVFCTDKEWSEHYVPLKKTIDALRLKLKGDK